MTEKIVKTEAQWREDLTPTSFEVTRKKAPSAPSPDNTGIITNPAYTAAFAVPHLCLRPTQNLTLAVGGPATLHR